MRFSCVAGFAEDTLPVKKRMSDVKKGPRTVVADRDASMPPLRSARCSMWCERAGSEPGVVSTEQSPSLRHGSRELPTPSASGRVESIETWLPTSPPCLVPRPIIF